MGRLSYTSTINAYIQEYGGSVLGRVRKDKFRGPPLSYTRRVSFGTYETVTLNPGSKVRVLRVDPSIDNNGVWSNDVLTEFDRINPKTEEKETILKKFSGSSNFDFPKSFLSSLPSLPGKTL